LLHVNGKILRRTLRDLEVVDGEERAPVRTLLNVESSSPRARAVVPVSG
jgi:hypothetical protein